ncbi:MAG TPA: VOC family protein [Paenirhodobacter sp.]
MNTTATFGMGRVALTVNDLATVGEYYEKAVGLAQLSRDGENATYGAGDTVLLELRQDKAARRRSPREAGLFHTAFLLPHRADLGRYTKFIAENRIPVVGASDHAVSEALYLTDPEGNGIEVYSDRPAVTWKWNGSEVHMVTEELDIGDLIASAGESQWQGAPEGAVVGHVHLQVGALQPAEAFYHGLLGLDITTHYPGATFYSAEGYHHHVATNMWNSRGAGKRDFPSTGLTDVAITIDPLRAQAIQARAAAEGRTAGLTLEDPWGTPITLTVA